MISTLTLPSLMRSTGSPQSGSSMSENLCFASSILSNTLLALSAYPLVVRPNDAALSSRACQKSFDCLTDSVNDSRSALCCLLFLEISKDVL